MKDGPVDGDIVKCSWRDEEFYALLVARGERDMAICVLNPPPDYRQLPLMSVVAYWKRVAV